MKKPDHTVIGYDEPPPSSRLEALEPVEPWLDDGAPEGELPVPRGTWLADRYVVERVLAEGGMGVVCLGRHLQLDQPVAIKFLRKALSGNPGLVQRFVNEARALASLRSEHTVRVLDVGQLDSGRPYFVMEYLEGIDLESWVTRNGPLGVEMAVIHVLEACEALGEAHARGIVHRDVKPENLFLCTAGPSQNIVKILDFGVAKRVGSARGLGVTGPQESLGSPWYMSPEQILAPRQVDYRTDIWSLGVVLHRLLTGLLPFDGETAAEVFNRILNEPPQSLRPQAAWLDSGLERIVLRCLEKRVDSRYQTMTELSQALKGYLAYRREGSLADSAVKSPAFPRVSGPPAESVESVYDELPRDSDLPHRRRSKAVFGALALLLAASAVALYVAVADRAGMIHVHADSLGRWVPPPLSDDGLAPAELDSDGPLFTVFPKGVIGQRASVPHALRAEPEPERADTEEQPPADDEAKGAASAPVAPAPAAPIRRPAPGPRHAAPTPRATPRPPTPRHARPSPDEPAPIPIIPQVELPPPEPSSAPSQPSSSAPEAPSSAPSQPSSSAPETPDLPPEYRE